MPRPHASPSSAFFYLFTSISWDTLRETVFWGPNTLFLRRVGSFPTCSWVLICHALFSGPPGMSLWCDFRNETFQSIFNGKPPYFYWFMWFSVALRTNKRTGGPADNKLFSIIPLVCKCPWTFAYCVFFYIYFYCWLNRDLMSWSWGWVFSSFWTCLLTFRINLACNSEIIKTLWPSLAFSGRGLVGIFA